MRRAVTQGFLHFMALTGSLKFFVLCFFLDINVFCHANIARFPLKFKLEIKNIMLIFILFQVYISKIL
jgi:hypothetical protein